MDQLSYHRHRFPPPIIQHAICLCRRLAAPDPELISARPDLEVLHTLARCRLCVHPGILPTRVTELAGRRRD